MSDVFVNYDNLHALLSGVAGNLKAKIDALDLTDAQKADLTILDHIVKTGDGTKFLSNDGTYKTINYSSLSDMSTKIGVINSALTVGTNATEAWDTTTVIASAVARHAFGCVQYNGNIYCIGGLTNTTTIGTLYIYNIANNSWTTGPSMTTARSGFACVQYNGKIYCIGGYTGSTYLTSIEVYDIASAVWTTLTTVLTAARAYNRAVVSNGNIYIMGGYNGTSYLTSMEIYSISGNTISAGTSMNTAKGHFGCVLYNDKIYCIGGNTGSAVNTVDIYNIYSSTWSSGTAMTTSRYSFGCDVYNGKIYCIGGYNGTSYLTAVEVYDVNSNAWTTDTNSLGTAKGYFGCIFYNGILYCLCGYTGSSLATAVSLKLVYTGVVANGISLVSSVLSYLTTSGDGTKYLMDNGKYQTLTFADYGYRALTTDEITTISNNIKAIMEA
jgi:N-acetylneuraminic acid mutarotase